MCGRTCLTLEPAQICCACKYTPKKLNNNNKAHQQITPQVKDESNCRIEKNDEKYVEFITPEWRSEYNFGRKYLPSYNIAPTDITPVLVSSDFFNEPGENAEDTKTRILVPMMWGMIPFWHKGDYRKHGLSTNNCRLEHMLDSKLYRGPFRRGQRCVVLCEGFYEWQTTKSAKPSERAVHLLYMPQAKGVEIYNKTTWSADNINLLKMAGLYDVWEDEHGDKIFSYSIITFESSKIMSWLHHRMPAVLDKEQQVADWLDYKRVTDEQALATLRPATQLEWHRVSNLVNNSRNKSEQCNKPYELVQVQKPPMNKTMMAWLNVRKRREEVLAKTSELSDDECNGGADGTTSESDAEQQQTTKRQRFCEYKQIKTEQQYTLTDSGSENPQCEKNSF